MAIQDATTGKNSTPVGITGLNSSSAPTNPVRASVTGDLGVTDGISSGGVQGLLTLTTANTSYELKVGSSRLSNRKVLTARPTAKMYWGYTSAVTTSTGTLMYPNEFWEFDLSPNDSNVTIYVVSATAGATVSVTESV
jgi:hypothetical protein